MSTSNSEVYAYDGLNQVASFSRGTLNGTKTGLTGAATRSQAWDFDALGNFDSQTTDGTTQTRAANKQNEITSISGATTPAYDVNGNLTTDETGRTFKYDAWNRLVEVRNSSSTLLATYRYDALSRRVRETRGSTTTDLYYTAQWQVMEERVGSAVVVSYVWSPVYVDAMICRDRDTDANGTLDERLYAVQDANWNVTALLDTAGTVVERFAYDPYGSNVYLTGSWGARTTSNYAWSYLYQGRQWDADVGGHTFRLRESSPTLGRFLQLDPLGFAGRSANLFAAMQNDPVNLLDPWGTAPKPGSPTEKELRDWMNELWKAARSHSDREYRDWLDALEQAKGNQKEFAGLCKNAPYRVLWDLNYIRQDAIRKEGKELQKLLQGVILGDYSIEELEDKLAKRCGPLSKAFDKITEANIKKIENGTITIDDIVDATRLDGASQSCDWLLNKVKSWRETPPTTPPSKDKPKK